MKQKHIEIEKLVRPDHQIHLSSIEFTILRELEIIAYDAVGMLGTTKNSCQSQITNLDLSKMTINKDVVTLKVSVNHRWIKFVQISQAT